MSRRCVESLRSATDLYAHKTVLGRCKRWLRFTRDSECGIQVRLVDYLYPYKLGRL